MTFDYEAIAKRYKKDVNEAKTKVDNYAAKVKAELKDFYSPDKIDAEVEKIVVGNIGNLFVLSGLDYAKDQYEKGNVKKANVIVLGVSSPEDRNSYAKNSAINDWKVDPKGAVAKGKVREAVSQKGNTYPVPLWYKQVDRVVDGKTTKVQHPNFGEDIPVANKVTIPVIVCGWITGNESKPAEDFMMGSMSWDTEIKHKPDIGKKSTVYGRINGEYLTILKDAYEGYDIYEKAYDVANRVLPTTDIWMDLALVNDQPVIEMRDGARKSVYTTFATRGRVQKHRVEELVSQYNQKPYSKASITIGDSDVVGGIKLSTYYEPTIAYIEQFVNDNDDVIVIGRKKSFVSKKDGMNVKDNDGNNVMIPTYELWGVIKSFNSEHDEVMARLKARGLI